MRRFFAVLGLFCVACSQATTPTVTAPPVATASPVPDPSPTPEPTPVVPDPAAFNVEASLEHTRVLVNDIGLRPSGTDADAKAGDYLASTMSAIGLVVTRQVFDLPQGTSTANIIGVPSGFDPARPYLLVGGHYDSLNGPGGNDNGTGAGAILEIARALHAKSADLPVVVVAFGAEERQPYPEKRNHLGSIHYVSQMDKTARDNLVAMLNVDMVGRGPYLIAGKLSFGSREATDRLVAQGKALGIDIREKTTPNYSDHGTFTLAGMNAGWIWSGEDPVFHSPKDTFDRIQPERVEQSGRLALAFLRSYPNR